MQRKVKSFVLRAGRTSPRQKQGLELWFHDYALPVDGVPWDLNKYFGQDANVILEIGFGMGASLLHMAKAHPENHYIGIEVHRAGVGSLAADLHDNAVSNVRLVMHDAVEVLNTQIADNSLTGVQLFFPDPWPKKRHHKRRIVQTDFVALLVNKLKPGGFIHMATDWEEYAVHMLEVLSAHPLLLNHAPEGFSPRPDTRPETKFEQRGQRLGHGVWDLICYKSLKLV